MLYGVVAIQILILLLSIGLWSLFFARRFGNSQTLWPSRSQDVAPHGLVDMMGVVLVWLLLQAIAAVIALPLMDISFAEASNLAEIDPEKILKFGAVAMAFQLLAMFGAIFWLLLRYKKVNWLGQVSLFARDLKVGLVAAAMIIPVTFLVQLVVIQLIPYEHPTLDSMKEVSSFAAIACAWFAAVIGAPLTEEFFFRGLLQGFMQRLVDVRESFDRTFIGGRVDEADAEPSSQPPPVVAAELFATPGNLDDPWESASGVSEVNSSQRNDNVSWRFWLPIVASSILFAGAHMGQGPAPIPLFVLSLGIGYVYRKTGSIMPCIVIHMALNAISMVMLMLQIWYPDAFPPDATSPS